MLLIIPVWVGPEKSAVADDVSDIVKQFKLEERLVRAIVQVESSGNPIAKSKKGAVGLMQIMPRSWDWIVKSVLKQGTPWGFSCATDRECNLTIGCAYLKWLFDYWNKNKAKLSDMTVEDAVIASYFTGQGIVSKKRGTLARLSKNTRSYLAKVRKEIK